MDRKKYIVFFDLDGTITSMNSGYALVRKAYAKRMITRRGLINAIICSVLYKLRIMPAEKIIRVMGRWLRGLKQDILSAIAGEAVEEYLFDSVFEEIYDEIRSHRSNNADLAILSSAIGEICRPVARHLGIDNIISTEMECINGELTGLSSGSYCFGDEKERRMTCFCNEKGFDKASAYYYADSFSDLAALETVGNPVCINPGSRLRKKAIEMNWRICNWNNPGRRK